MAHKTFRKGDRVKLSRWAAKTYPNVKLGIGVVICRTTLLFYPGYYGYCVKFPTIHKAIVFGQDALVKAK